MNHAYRPRWWHVAIAILLVLLAFGSALTPPAAPVSAQVGTDTPTATPTNTPETPTDTPTATPTNTPETPTDTPTATPTNTPETPTETATSTPTITPVPASSCPGGGNSYTTILGKGMGSNTQAITTAKIVIPNSDNVIALYGQLAGKEQGTYKYARFLRPNGTYVNDQSKESPAYRRGAVFWFGQNLTPTNLANWRARLIGASTSKPFVQRAFILYPTYATAGQYANAFATFAVSSQNHVYHDTANGWIPAQQQTLTLPPATQPVDISVMVAVVDNDRDTLPFQLTISAGPVSQTVTANGPTNGDLLNLVAVTLHNVPEGTSQVVLDLVSPPGGDSVAMVGATAHYACGD